MRFLLTLLIAVALLGGVTISGASVPKKIVLIGGAKSEGPARHDYPNGIRLLKALLESSPDAFAGKGLIVESYPNGWPVDPAALDGAATVVWYFDGLEKHPLHDAARRTRFEALMKRGAGLVAIHQASTLPAGERNIDLLGWLGASRDGMYDRTDELVKLAPASRAHPVNRGVKAFTYFDEFYPTLQFHSDPSRITPILRGKLHVQARDGKPVVIGSPQNRTVAWAFSRQGGGRSFGFSGGHYLAVLDEPAIRKTLLNAIFWTAGIEVPKRGVRSDLPDRDTRNQHKATNVPATNTTVGSSPVRARSALSMTA